MMNAYSPPPTRWPRASRTLAASFSLLIAAAALHAAPPPGRLLAAQCAQCHGTNGQAVAGFESIAGKNASELFKELREMKTRPVESIMDRQARGYTDEQLRQLAVYLSQLPRATETAAEEDDD